MVRTSEKKFNCGEYEVLYGLSNEPSTNVPQNGDKLPKFVVFWIISTIKDEKSAAKFHYIKTISSIVVAQSIAFRVISIYWQGDDPFP